MSKMVVSCILLALTLLVGFLLHQKGKPYNEILFAAHKIFTIIMIVMIVMVTVRFFRQDNVTVIFYVLAGTMALTLIGLFASGAMMSLDKFHGVMLLIHQGSTVIFLVSYSLFIYKLLTFKAV